MKLEARLIVFIAMACLLPAELRAQTGAILSTVVSFSVTNGANPVAGLVTGADGNFYGTTEYGGTSSNGTVFQLTTNGVLNTLASFSYTNGAFPMAPLLLGPDGNLYGTTTGGGISNSGVSFFSGNGTVFQVASNGTINPLVYFNGTNGANPRSGLILGADGNFYGTTQNGGVNNTNGTVFQLSTNGSLKTLVSFNGTNGAFPVGGLLLGKDGNFYGTTAGGGTGSNGGNGTLFQLKTNGTLNSLVLFNGTNGLNPTAGLVQGADGSLYGTTPNGGTNGGNGTLFQMPTNGPLKTLLSFNGTNGSSPGKELVFGPDGNLYGTTSLPEGSVFQLTTGGAFNTLFTFSGTNGAFPDTALLLGKDGNFYGTTEGGGTNGNGTVFRLAVPMAPVLQKAAVAGGNFTFLSSAVAGLPYQLQYNTNLASTNWLNLGGQITATGGTLSNSIAVTNSRNFYRVIVK